MEIATEIKSMALSTTHAVTSMRFSDFSFHGRLKKLSSIRIDKKNNLWVSSAHRDNYHNASIYTWGPNLWKAKMPIIK